MNGRFETQLCYQDKIDKKLESLPQYVKDYCYSFSYGAQIKTAHKYIGIIENFYKSIKEDSTTVTPEEAAQNVARYMVAKKTKTVIQNGVAKVTPTSIFYQQLIYTVLKNFMGYLYSNKLIEINPITEIKRPKGEDKVQRPEITPDELQQMLGAVLFGAGSTRARKIQNKWKSRDFLILLLFILTGMRRSALSEINVEDINLETGELTVIDKGRKTHVYQISSIMQYVNDWLYDREELLHEWGVQLDALFVSRQKARLSTDSIAEIVHKYSEVVLGEGISPHKIRYAFVTNIIKETGDIEFARRAVGHSNISTTQRYVVMNDSDVKQRSADIIVKQIHDGFVMAKD